MPNNSIFFKPKDPRLAKIISIKSPIAFQKSIRMIKKDGVTLKEKQALVLAQTRAKAQLNRKNLSLKERIEFRTISTMKLPKVTR